MRGLAALAIAAAVGGCGAIREGRETKLYEHQVQQARSQYEAARTNLERCVSAKLVAVAYADMDNTADAQAWRARESVDCQAAFAELGPVTDMDAGAR